MSVEDLVKGMLFWETFVHDVEEFPSQVGFVKGMLFWETFVHDVEEFTSQVGEFQGGLYNVMWRALLWFCVLLRFFGGS